MNIFSAQKPLFWLHNIILGTYYHNISRQYMLCKYIALQMCLYKKKKCLGWATPGGTADNSVQYI